MGRFAIGAAVVVVGVVVWTVSERHARRRTDHLVAAITNGEQLTEAQRVTDTRKTLAVVIEQVAALRRALLVFCLVFLAAGTWAIATISDQSDVSKHLVVDLGTTTCNFLRLQNTRVTEEIRQRQQRRDDLAAQIIDLQDDRNSRPDLETIPGFNDMPASAQEFVRAASAGSVAAADANIADARRRLAIYDEDLTRLRAEADDVRSLAAKSTCTQALPAADPPPTQETQ